MTEQYGPISEQDLHAYVDDQLSTQRRTEVEVYLAEHPNTAKRMAEFQNYNRGLHGLLDHTLSKTIPERLKVPPGKAKTPSLLIRAAAILLALTVGTIFGWISRGNMQTMPIHTMAMVNIDTVLTV